VFNACRVILAFLDNRCRRVLGVLWHDSQSDVAVPNQEDGNLADVGTRLRESLRLRVRWMGEMLGEEAARRLSEAAFDSIDWQDRESAAFFLGEDLAGGISPKAGGEPWREVATRALAHVPFLEGIPEEALLRVIALSRLKKSPPDTVVVRQGEYGSSMYVLLSGLMEVIDESDKKQKAIATLGSGEYFGELSLVYGRPRAATVRAITDCELVEIPRDAFERSFCCHFTAAKAIQEKYAQVRLLSRMTLFTELAPAEILFLTRYLEDVAFRAGEVIVRQGDEGDSFYVLTDGTARVLVESRDGRREIARLSSGECFGETALLGAGQRTATVEAVTEVKCLRLPGDVFFQLVDRSPQLGSLLRQLSSRRTIDREKKLRPASSVMSRGMNS
jgi:CRP-like cAMP-binding protein